MERVMVHVVDVGRRHLALRWNEPGTRVVRQKTAGTADRKVAEERARETEQALMAGVVLTPTKITWEEFRERVEDERLVLLAAGTGGPVMSILNHIERVIRPKYLSEVSAQGLGLVFARLRQSGYRDATLAGLRAHLRSLLSWAKAVGYLDVVPEVPRVRRAKGVPLMKGRPIKGEEFVRMLRAVRKVRPNDSKLWRRYLVGLWRSGLRVGESLLLGWDQDAAISVDLSGKHPRLRITAEAEKGRRDRLLPITPDFAMWLLRVPVGQRVGRVFPIDGRQPGATMTVKRVGKVISAIGEAAEVVVNAGQEKFATAHDLRRAFGTRWAARLSATQLKLLMRHESIETTLRYYVGHEADEIADQLWRAHGRLVAAST